MCASFEGGDDDGSGDDGSGDDGSGDDGSGDDGSGDDGDGAHFTLSPSVAAFSSGRGAGEEGGGRLLCTERAAARLR